MLKELLKTLAEQNEELARTNDDDMVDVEWGDDASEDQPEEFDDELDTADYEEVPEDPDRQGLIRVVPNAHLVYKRASEDGTYEELWIYNTGEDFREELETRRAILAGTDIPPNKMKSPDGTQSFTLWDAGNAQLIRITGLPS